MGRPRYERLSAQDLSFLVMENANVHMHVGAVNICDAAPVTTANGGIDFELYRTAIASVLHLVPRYRQRLMWIPTEDRAVWVDDVEFDLDYHIRHTALPRPGSDEQLKRLTSRILTQQLDRARPLWEMWVVEGLQDTRFAVITKVHHCMIDGISGIDLAQILFSPKPDYEIQEAPPFVPRTPPSRFELMRDSWLQRANLPWELMRGAQDFKFEADTSSKLLVRARALAGLVGYAAQPAAKSPLNGPVGPQRRFDWLRMPLTEFKAVSRTFGCTVNDVVIATVAGAVREFLLSHHVRPRDIDFRIAAPVSVRRREERGRLGNRISAWVVQLPVAEPDPRKRLETLKAATQELKSSQQALGVQTMMAIAEWTPTVLLSLGMRAASVAANMVVTNVPGPRIPLYVLGAKVLDFYPVVPLARSNGLGIALISYAGTIHWGFNADYRLVPDLRKFVELIEASFRDLARAAAALR